MGEPLNISFCVNDAYIQYICVSILSIHQNNTDLPINIHILTNSISKESKKRLKAIPLSNLHQILIHIIDDSLLENLKFGRFTKYAWYRILLPKVLTNISKVLYLDADTLVVGDLSPILKFDIENLSVAGVKDIGTIEHHKRWGSEIKPPFVCSGVLWMNLDYWRENEITEKIIEWASINENLLEYPDQDSINYICQDSKALLPLKFGIIPSMFTRNELFKNETQELLEAYHNPLIIHYAGKHLQPWMACSEYYNVDLWRDYNKRLKHPSKILYDGNLWTRFKVWMWNRQNDRGSRMRNEIEKKINRLKSNLC